MSAVGGLTVPEVFVQGRDGRHVLRAQLEAYLPDLRDPRRRDRLRDDDDAALCEPRDRHLGGGFAVPEPPNTMRFQLSGKEEMGPLSSKWCQFGIPVEIQNFQRGNH